jgi:phage tail-like protein
MRITSWLMVASLAWLCGTGVTAADTRIGPVDPITGFVSLTIDGVDVAFFQQLVGITSDVDVSALTASTKRDVFFKKIPARLKPPTVIMKRGLTNSLDLWTWHQAVLMGDFTARKNCTVTLYDTTAKPVAQFSLELAWPAKIEIASAPDGTASEIATFVAEHVQRVVQ